MNVAFDPWIPVVTLEGEMELASLVQVLTEGHRYADLGVRPHERIALMRLLSCVAHAALNGPKDYDEWCEVSERLPEAAKAYLESRREAFALFHPTHPWLQVAGLESGKGADDGWQPVSKLTFFYASGSNSTLFDHEGMDNESRMIPLETTLLSMLTFQCFSPRGLISQVHWQGVQTSKSSKDAPCVSASMAHALVRREDLLYSIQWNLPTYEEIERTCNCSIGRPLWEHMPKSMMDRAATLNATTTYLGRLVPLTRVIQLHPDGRRMLMGDGLPYPAFPESHPEPTAIVMVRTKDKKGERVLLSYRPGHALWRELPAMLVKRKTESSSVKGGPLCLGSLQEDEACDLVVCALARDQATILDTAESVFHVPVRLRSVDGAAAYQTGVEEADIRSKRLGKAIEEYRRTLDGGWDGRMKSAGPNKGELLVKLRSTALMHYWTSVESNLGLLMARVEAYGTDRFEPCGATWRAMLWDKAREAYQLVCGQETPRQIQAFAAGWKNLSIQPKKQEEA